MNSNKNETGPKMKNPWITFWETNLVLQLMLKLRIKSKTAMSWSLQKKKHCIFCKIYFAQKEFFNICIFIQSIVYWILNFTYQKRILQKLFCLFLKSLKAFNVSLSAKSALSVPNVLSAQGSQTIFGNWKHFKNDEQCFLFHLRSSFRFQDM